MSNFIYYEKLEDYEKQVEKAKLCDEKDKKIKILEAENRELSEGYNEEFKENVRLNNIINELEKWLVEWREMLDCPDFYEEGIIDCINDTLTKLQELKRGKDNER